MARLMFITFMVGALSIRVMAQDDPRPEVRVVNHWQKFTDNSTIGFSAYVNEPDITHGGARVFGVAGVTLRNTKRTKWLELMGGGLITPNGFEPALDLRSQIRLKFGVVLWGEQLHLFKSNRTLLAYSITKTVGRLKVGVESDTWHRKASHTMGVGPGGGLVINRHFLVWTAYQFGFSKQQDIARTYLIFNW